MGAIVKSNKWYGRFWPPERRKIKLMQALVDYYQPELDKKIEEEWRNYLLFGKPFPPQPTTDKIKEAK